MTRGGRDWSPYDVVQVMRCARDILEGRLGVIVGARRMAALTADLRAARAEPLSTFLAVDSETDDLPLGAVREHWDPDALAARDVELARAEAAYHEPVRLACLDLLARLAEQRSLMSLDDAGRILEAELRSVLASHAAPAGEVEALLRTCQELNAYGEGAARERLRQRLEQELDELAATDADLAARLIAAYRSGAL